MKKRSNPLTYHCYSYFRHRSMHPAVPDAPYSSHSMQQGSRLGAPLHQARYLQVRWVWQCHISINQMTTMMKKKTDQSSYMSAAQWYMHPHAMIPFDWISFQPDRGCSVLLLLHSTKCRLDMEHSDRHSYCQPKRNNVQSSMDRIVQHQSHSYTDPLGKVAVVHSNSNGQLGIPLDMVPN